MAGAIKTIPVLDNAFNQVTYEERDGYGIAEGDIIIGTLEELNRPRAVVVTKVGGTRWPNRTVPFVIESKMPVANRIAIYEAITTWMMSTKITFVERTSQNKKYYPDYIQFIPATGTTCSSHVGKRGGKQLIRLSPRCHHGNTVHEIGHALGLWHEQSRADRDHYIKIHWDQIKPEHLHNFNQHLNDGVDIGAYDYGSIMHYSAHAFSAHGNITIEPTQKGAKIGQRSHLSERDIQAINKIYQRSNLNHAEKEATIG